MEKKKFPNTKKKKKKGKKIYIILLWKAMFTMTIT